MLELKRCKTEFKADLAKRTVEAYASTFGNVDGNDDIAVKGSYADTLKTDLPANQIKVKRNHTTIIGKPLHAEEDSTGLLTVSRFSETDLGNETLILVQDQALDELSIGFKALDKNYTTMGGRRVRELKRIKLYEWSFMDDPPANTQARVTEVKSLYDVSCVLDQMQSGIYALQRLASLPPEITARIAALIKDLESLPNEDPAEIAEAAAQINSLSGLFTQFATSLRTANT